MACHGRQDRYGAQGAARNDFNPQAGTQALQALSEQMCARVKGRMPARPVGCPTGKVSPELMAAGDLLMLRHRG